MSQARQDPNSFPKKTANLILRISGEHKPCIDMNHRRYIQEKWVVIALPLNIDKGNVIGRLELDAGPLSKRRCCDAGYRKKSKQGARYHDLS